MYSLPHICVPKRLLFSVFIHFYFLGTEWLQRAILLMQKVDLWEKLKQ